MHWLLTKGRYPFLLLVAVAGAWLGSLAGRVDVEKNNESLISRDPVGLGQYERFKRDFGNDEDLLLTVTRPDLLTEAGLAFLSDVTARVAAMDGVVRVFSLANALELVPGELGPDPVPLLRRSPGAPDLAANARAALDRNPDFTGMLVSADRDTAAVVAQIEDRPGDDRYRAAIIAGVRGLIEKARADGVEAHLTGISVQKHDVTAFVERDQRILIPLAVVALGATLLLFFRRPLGLVLPLSVTGLSVAATLGAYFLAGLQLNAITSLLPPIVMVLSLAVSVHLIQGWLDAETSDGVGRIRGVVRSLLFPCFFCSLTTALGFASLLTSDMPAVRQFGTFAAFGVTVSFLVGMTLVPVGLTFVPLPGGRAAGTHRWMGRVLESAAGLTVRHPRGILVVFTALTLLGLAGVPMIRNNTDLVRFLDEHAPLRRDTLFVDRNLTGSSAIEFVVSRRDGRPLTSLEDVRRLAVFEEAAKRRPEITNVASITAVLRQIQRAQSGGDRLELPHTEDQAGYAFELIGVATDQTLVRRVITPDFRRARVSVRMRAVGTAVAAPLADSLLGEGRRLLGADYEVVATGAFYRVAEDSNRLVVSQVKSFGLALVLVFLAIGALFRSVRLTFIAAIPNIMPIVWTGGIMGAFGIDLSTGTAMIASAVIGLVVDDTIHYLTHFHRVLRGDPGAAVRETTTGIGAALVMNNLVLVLGFWVGCFGSFKPTVYFSLLSGVTMISALVSDLLVTPACLLVFGRHDGGTR